MRGFAFTIIAICLTTLRVVLLVEGILNLHIFILHIVDYERQWELALGTDSRRAVVPVNFTREQFTYVIVFVF